MTNTLDDRYLHSRRNDYTQSERRQKEATDIGFAGFDDFKRAHLAKNSNNNHVLDKKPVKTNLERQPRMMLTA